LVGGVHRFRYLRAAFRAAVAGEFIGKSTVASGLGTSREFRCLCSTNAEETTMGRGILLWLLGVPIPIILLLALIWH
jgi:hypothetical protein